MYAYMSEYVCVREPRLLQKNKIRKLIESLVLLMIIGKY